MNLLCILGSQNDINGEIFTEGRKRIEAGKLIYDKLPIQSVIFTGGWGAHFNEAEKPHWFYASELGVRLGIPRDRIVVGVESGNTSEDMELLMLTISELDAGCVIFVTSEYHLPRATLLATRLITKPTMFFGAETTLTPSLKPLIDLEFAKIRSIFATT